MRPPGSQCGVSAGSTGSLTRDGTWMLIPEQGWSKSPGKTHWLPWDGGRTHHERLGVAGLAWNGAAPSAALGHPPGWKVEMLPMRHVPGSLQSPRAHPPGDGCMWTIFLTTAKTSSLSPELPRVPSLAPCFAISALPRHQLLRPPGRNGSSERRGEELRVICSCPRPHTPRTTARFGQQREKGPSRQDGAGVTAGAAGVQGDRGNRAHGSRGGGKGRCPGTHTHGARSSQCGRKERREGASSLSAEVTGYLLYGKQNEIRFVLENPPTRRDDLWQLAHTSGERPEGCPGASFPVGKTGCSLLPSPRGVPALQADLV